MGNAMTNNRLRDALHRSGHTPSDIAEKLAVDPKTVERWITLDRTPYPRHRHQIAALLREGESYFWPNAVTRQQQDSITESEIVHVYPHRASVPNELWTRLFTNASEVLGILVYSGMFLVDQYPKLPQILRDKAKAGAQVQVLFGDPSSAQVANRGAEENIGDSLAAKIRNVMTHYRSLSRIPNVEIRLHATTLYNSIYRFDDEMLVNSHVYGFPAAQAPVLHIRRLSAGVLFDTYAESFQNVWGDATSAWQSKVA
jgi:hypothetical protein